MKVQWGIQRYWQEGVNLREQKRSVPVHRKFLNFKNKNDAFCALLSIDFKFVG